MIYKEKINWKIRIKKYRLKIENMCVDITYSKNNKSFNECMLNILKQKVKKD